MHIGFDEGYRRNRIRQPDWYMELAKFMHQARKKIDSDSEEAKELTKKIRLFFEHELEAGRVALGNAGKDFDEERKHIDTIIIHHTSDKPGYRLSYMNAVQMLNLYVSYYVNPTKEEKELKGKPLWSGHFKDDKQVFYAYHWLMRMNGGFERLLEDNEIGWQAGNWDVNTRSVAICIDNDYEDKDPEESLLKKLAQHIRSTYPDVKTENIVGHCEISDTKCPGTNFLKTWKPKLTEFLV